MGVPMGRFPLEAVVMGLAIGLGAILLNVWVGDASWPRRLLALAFVGALLCALQYGFVRLRR